MEIQPELPIFMPNTASTSRINRYMYIVSRAFAQKARLVFYVITPLVNILRSFAF